MNITPMTALHVPMLAKLERECFSAPWSEAALYAETENPTACFLTALEGETVLGYGGMHTVLGESYIDNIAVFPKYRRQGVARAIVSALIERGRTPGGFITLEVRAGNAGAIALYTSLGFEKAGIRKNFYTAPREDAWLLTLYF